AVFRSTSGGASFTPICGAAGTGLPNGPVSSLVGAPNNPNRLYAAVTAPNAASNASTAIFVSNDTGATWTQVFGMAQAGGLISPAFQTVLKVASAPGGALAVGIVGFFVNPITNQPFNTAIGVFWSGNSGATWTPNLLPAAPPFLNNGGQAPVNFAIAIDPKFTNLVYVSGDRIAADPFTVSAF